MRTLVVALLLTTTSLSTTFAADINAVSRIDAVTVFPQGAEVTRIAEARIAAGEHTLIFDGLPGELSPETLRIEGVGGTRIEIGSVDSKLIYASTESLDENRERIEKDIKTLGDERATLDQTIGDAEYQKALMQQLASATLIQKPQEGSPRILDAQGLGGVLDLVASRLAGLGKITLDARARQREIDRLVEDLNNKLFNLAPSEDQRMRVAVHLSAPAETQGTFRLSYRVQFAAWYPIYEARLAKAGEDGKAKMEIVRRAEVKQTTVESWDNVALTLSTARPMDATAAPDLQPVAIIGANEELRENNTDREMGFSDYNEAPIMLSKGPEATRFDRSVKQAVQKQAQVEIAGFQALYRIADRVTVDNTATAKKVRIATDEIEAKLSAFAAPKLDPNAYLTAAFTLGGDTLLLPGPVMLYRDGVFMGQGKLPMLSPGEAVKLGFGADDLIKVKRIEVNRRTAEEGLITTSNVDERAFDITIKNLHEASIPITVLDQMPYSTDQKIVVEILSGMTPATVRDYERRRGVLAWSFDLASRDTKVLKHGYKISWPREIKLGTKSEDRL